jgi:hypothetical protein
MMLVLRDTLHVGSLETPRHAIVHAWFKIDGAADFTYDFAPAERYPPLQSKPERGAKTSPEVTRRPSEPATNKLHVAMPWSESSLVGLNHPFVGNGKSLMGR